MRLSARIPALALASLAALTAAAVTAAPGQAVVQRPIETAAFTGIALKGAADITITQASAISVVASGTEAAVADLKAEVRDGVLYLAQQSRGRIGRRDSLRVAIAMPDLRSVALTGSGDVAISNMKLDRVSLDIVGAGDVTASGTCNHFDARVAGAGDVSARTLKCRTASVQVSGAGDVSVYADQGISAQIGGVGDIRIYGNPQQRSVNASGLGDITFHETAQ